MKRTLFTKKVIKNRSLSQKFIFKENFTFEELKPDEPEELKPNDSMEKKEPTIETNDNTVNSEIEQVDDEKFDFESIISQIRSEYELKVSEAYQRGFNDAEKILREKINAELNEHILLFDQLVKNLYSEIEMLEKKIESIVLSLAIEIAKKIVKKEIDSNNDFVVNQVKEAIKRVVGIEKIKLRINPEDEKLIKELKPELLQIADSTREIIVEADPSIERGGCIIESELGNVDARISTQFSQIENSLIETFELQ